MKKKKKKREKINTTNFFLRVYEYLKFSYKENIKHHHHQKKKKFAFKLLPLCVCMCMYVCVGSRSVYLIYISQKSFNRVSENKNEEE